MTKDQQNGLWETVSKQQQNKRIAINKNKLFRQKKKKKDIFNSQNRVLKSRNMSVDQDLSLGASLSRNGSRHVRQPSSHQNNNNNNDNNTNKK